MAKLLSDFKNIMKSTNTDITKHSYYLLSNIYK